MEKGYIILENVFTNSELQQVKDEIINFIKMNKTIRNADGISIPDFCKKSNDFKKTIQLKSHQKIKDKLNFIFKGCDYRFCQHNDIGINRIAVWHKDKLNGKYSKYETVNIWSEHKGEKHEIYKVLIYLQDHSKNNDGLQVVPYSHLTSSMETKKVVQLKPKLGDVVIFDQRITHRGMNRQVKDSRILVSFGFGKNNLFTDNFEKGTVQRQNAQNKFNK
jgi:hypothetical protein